MSDESASGSAIPSQHPAKFAQGITEDLFVSGGKVGIGGHKRYKECIEKLPHFVEVYRHVAVRKVRDRVHQFIAKDWALRAGMADGLCTLSNAEIDAVLVASKLSTDRNMKENALPLLPADKNEIVTRLICIILGMLNGKGKKEDTQLTVADVRVWHSTLCAPIKPANEKQCNGEWETETSKKPGCCRDEEPRFTNVTAEGVVEDEGVETGIRDDKPDDVTTSKKDIATQLGRLCFSISEFLGQPEASNIKDGHSKRIGDVSAKAAETYMKCMRIAPFDVGNYVIAQLLVSYLYCKSDMLPVAVVPGAIPHYLMAVKSEPNQNRTDFSFLGAIFAHLQIEVLKAAIFQSLSVQNVTRKLDGSVEDALDGDAGKLKDCREAIVEEAYREGHNIFGKFVHNCKKELENYQSELNLTMAPECVETSEGQYNRDMRSIKALGKKLDFKLDFKSFHRHFSLHLDYKAASKRQVVTVHFCRAAKPDNVEPAKGEGGETRSKGLVALVGTAWGDDDGRDLTVQVCLVGAPFVFTISRALSEEEGTTVAQARLYSEFERWFVDHLQLALTTNVPNAIRETQEVARVVTKLAGNIDPPRGRFMEGAAFAMRHMRKSQDTSPVGLDL